jgi:hypothetical protein
MLLYRDDLTQLRTIIAIQCRLTASYQGRNFVVSNMTSSPPSKSCNRFMETEHTKKTLSDHVKDHNPGDINPNYGKFHPQFISSISSLKVTAII